MNAKLVKESLNEISRNIFGKKYDSNTLYYLGRLNLNIEFKSKPSGRDYVGFSWIDRTGKEHYEEISMTGAKDPIDMMNQIIEEIDYQNEKPVKESLNEIESTDKLGDFNKLVAALTKECIPCRVLLSKYQELYVECGWDYPEELAIQIFDIMENIGVDASVSAEMAGEIIKS